MGANGTDGLDGETGPTGPAGNYDVTKLESTGDNGHISLVANGTGPCLLIKGITGDHGLNVSCPDDTVLISRDFSTMSYYNIGTPYSSVALVELTLSNTGPTEFGSIGPTKIVYDLYGSSDFTRSNSSITYEGVKSKLFLLSTHITGSGGPHTSIVFYLAKDGVKIPHTDYLSTVNTTDDYFTYSGQRILLISPNETVSIFWEGTSPDGNLFIYHFYLTIKEII